MMRPRSPKLLPVFSRVHVPNTRTTYSSRTYKYLIPRDARRTRVLHRFTALAKSYGTPDCSCIARPHKKKQKQKIGRVENCRNAS